MYLIGFIIKCNNPPPKKKKSPTGSTSKTFANQIRLIKMCRLKRCCTLSTFSPGIKSSKTSAAIPFIFDKNYQVIGKRFLHSSSLLNYNWCMKKWMQYYFTITFFKKIEILMNGHYWQLHVPIILQKDIIKIVFFLHSHSKNKIFHRSKFLYWNIVS